MANILIKRLEKNTGIEANIRAVGKNASIIVDGTPKYIGEHGTSIRSGIGLLNRFCYQIKDLSGKLLINIKSSGLFLPSIEFQMGEKSVAVMRTGGFLRKNPVLYLRGHEYHLPRPDPKNGHFKIERWSFRFTDNQEMLISKPDDGKNLAALAIGYYFWAQKKNLTVPQVH